MTVPEEFKVTGQVAEFSEFSVEREFDHLPAATIYIDSSTTATSNTESRNSSATELSTSISSIEQVFTRQETQDLSNESKSTSNGSYSRENSELSATLPLRPQARNTIHWLSPITMVACLLTAGGLSIGHHCYYGWLSGQAVGSTNKQQWALGIGNGFAISIVFFCKTAIGIAYTQYLWRLLRLKPVSLVTINDAFGVAGNLFSLLNWEFICKMPLGTMLALILWLLPLTSLFTPATLSIDRAEFKSFKNLEVNNIGFNNKSLKAAYYPKGGLYMAPTFKRTFNAVAATGQQMLVSTPLSSQSNMSYELQAQVPLLRCFPANLTLYEAYFQAMKYPIEGRQVRDQPAKNSSLTTSASPQWVFDLNPGGAGVEVGYSASIPAKLARDSLLVYKLTSLRPTTSEQVFKNAVSFLEKMDSQLVIAINPDNKGMQVTECTLYNASITFDVVFANGLGTTTNVRKEWLESIDVSSKFITGRPAHNETKLQDGRNITTTIPASSGNATTIFKLFRDFANYFEGSIQVTRRPTPSITLLATNFLGTGVSDTRDVNRMLYRLTRNTSNAALYPTRERGRNKSIAETVEDFVVNVTLSTLGDPVLCNKQIANVTTSITQTVYLYESRNLVISYTIVIFASTLAVLFGLHAFVKNGVSHDTSVSAFATTMQDLKVREAFMLHPGGAQPLEKGLGKLRLRFKAGEGFKVVE